MCVDFLYPSHILICLQSHSVRVASLCVVLIRVCLCESRTRGPRRSHNIIRFPKQIATDKVFAWSELARDFGDPSLFFAPGDLILQVCILRQQLAQCRSRLQNSGTRFMPKERFEQVTDPEQGSVARPTHPHGPPTLLEPPSIRGDGELLCYFAEVNTLHCVYRVMCTWHCEYKENTKQQVHSLLVLDVL